MKKTIRIFAVVLAAAIGLMAAMDFAPEKSEILCEDILSQEEDSHEDYTDYNSPCISVGGSSLSGGTRTVSSNAVSRHLNSAKRSFPAKEALSGKSGKSLGMHSVVDFNSIRELFPSGLNSKSHSFIRMCRLSI